MAQGNFPVVVIGIEQLTPRVREYTLRSTNGKPLPPYSAGAHIALHTKSVERGLIVRHYSLVGGSVSGDDPRNTYRIAVQRADHSGGSAYIHSSLEIGSILDVGPPTNNFPLARNDANVLLLAGGIGITPIFSMARSLLRRKRQFKVIYAGRKREEMAYHDQLASLVGPDAQMHYSDSAGHPDIKEWLQTQPENTAAYVCGPTRMIEATQAAAAELGWRPDRVRTEMFGAAFAGHATPFDVHLSKSNRTIPVGADVSILDALLAGGVPVLWDCRRGECGLCPLNVISTDGVLQHADRYLSDEEKQSQSTLCICVSRTTGKTLVVDA